MTGVFRGCAQDNVKTSPGLKSVAIYGGGSGNKGWQARLVICTATAQGIVYSTNTRAGGLIEVRELSIFCCFGDLEFQMGGTCRYSYCNFLIVFVNIMIFENTSARSF